MLAEKFVLCMSGYTEASRVCILNTPIGISNENRLAGLFKGGRQTNPLVLSAFSLGDINQYGKTLLSLRNNAHRNSNIFHHAPVTEELKLVTLRGRLGIIASQVMIFLHTIQIVLMGNKITPLFMSFQFGSA